MTRAALVVGAIAAAASLPLSSALCATAAAPTFVLRGVVVQYIPPSGSVVGSLSVRVVKVNARGRALLGELVTVAVEQGSALNKDQLLLQKSLCTLTLKAPSPASILKGAADVRSIVPSMPAAQPPAAGSPPADTPANPDVPAKSDATGSDGAGGSGDHGSAKSGDRGGDQGQGQPADPASQGQGRSGGGSNGHK